MTLLNIADALRVGGTAVDKVYAGADLVWPTGSSGDLEAWKAEILADAPWAAWALEESGGANPFVDTGSNGVAWTPAGGVLTGIAPLPTGSAGFAAAGSGSAPIASLPSGNTPASINGSNVTVEAWFYKPAGSIRGGLVKIGGNGGTGWAFGIGGTTLDNAGSNLVLISEAIAWHNTGYVLATGIHHLVVVRGAGNAVTVYDNGAVAWTGSLSSPHAPNGGVTIGGYNNGSALRFLPSTVTMDEVAFYAAALSAGRVAAHYNGGAGSAAEVTADSPVIRLTLDEVLTTLTDFSGNARHLDPIGATTFNQPGPNSLPAVAFSTAAGHAQTRATTAQPTTFTYEMWVRIDGLPAAETLLATYGGSLASTSGSTSALRIAPDGKVNLSTASGTLAATSPLSLGAWHHIVGSVGAAGAKLRIDKTTVATSIFTAVASAATGEFYVRGGAPFQSTGTGAVKLAGIATWKSQLSDTRTDAHYDAA